MVGHVVGLTLIVAGVGIVVSGIVDALRSGPDVAVLLPLGVAVGAMGWITWNTTALPRQVRILDVFTTVTMAWVVLAFIGALPDVLTGAIEPLDNAVFESVSGFTNTGATVLRPIEGAALATGHTVPDQARARPARDGPGPSVPRSVRRGGEPLPPPERPTT
jgi:trk system potassium uptake protein TrkH